MHYSKYIPIDVINGPGVRATLFVSGCEHQCKGCYNQSTWSCTAGQPFDQSMVDRIISDLSDPRIVRKGLTLTGGDPLHPDNVDAIHALLKQVQKACPDKDIWCWTGYRLNELDEKQRKILPFINTLIDGKFEQQLADPNLKWRGSSNQVVHTLS